MKLIKGIKVLLCCHFFLTPYSISYADSVTDWHAFAVKTVGDRGSRTFAIIQAAVFDAVNGITPKYQYYKVNRIAPYANINAAVAAASATVLLKFAPDKAKEINSMYGKSVNEIPEGPQKDAGIAQGRFVANEILKLRQDDGYNRKITYHEPSLPGIFQPLEGKITKGLELPYTTPFVIQSASQFRPVPPPALTSSSYGKDLNEVKLLGSKESKARTQEQSAIALFWDDNIIMTWNMVANNEARRFGKSEIDNAHSLALFDLVMIDTLIAIFESKYYYKLWRPIDAIRQASKMNNPLIKADPKWTPLLRTSSSPEYASGHAAIAGAASYILTHIYKDNFPITIKTENGTNSIRSYKSYSDAALETTLSRIYAGHHLRTSSFRGYDLGEKVGQYVMKTTLLPL